MRCCVLMLACSMCVTLWSAESAPPPKKLSNAEIDALVQQLGNDDFKKRQDAEKQLGDQGEAARPALEKAAAGSKDPEVKQRTANLLKVINMPRDLAKLSPERREIAKLPLKSLADGEPAAGQLKTCAYGQGGDTLVDMGRTRVVIEGSPCNGESTMTMNVTGGGMSSGQTGSFKTQYANGVASFDFRGVKWTLSGGDTIKIAGAEFKTTGDNRHVVFLDKTGKLISNIELPMEKSDDERKSVEKK